MKQKKITSYFIRNQIEDYKAVKNGIISLASITLQCKNAFGLLFLCTELLSLCYATKRFLIIAELGFTTYGSVRDTLLSPEMAFSYQCLSELSPKLHYELTCVFNHLVNIDCSVVRKTKDKCLLL